MGIANIRFAEDNQDIDRGLNYLEQAYGLSKTDGDKKYVRWYTGFANLYLGREKDAVKNLSVIFDTSSRNYSSISYAQYLQTQNELSDVFGYDIDLFATIWARFSKNNFKDVATQALLDAQLMSHLTSIPQLDSSEKQNDILKKVNALRIQFIDAAKANDKKKLIELSKDKNLPFPPEIDIDDASIKNLASRDTQTTGKIIDAMPSYLSPSPGTTNREVILTVDFFEANNHSYWTFYSTSKVWRSNWTSDLKYIFPSSLTKLQATKQSPQSEQNNGETKNK